MFFQVIDRFLAETEARFGEVDDVLLGVMACSPASDSFLDEEKIVKFARMYRFNSMDIRLQVSSVDALTSASPSCHLHYLYTLQVQNMKEYMILDQVDTDELKDIGDVIQYADAKGDVAWQDFIQLLRIAITIPVTTASGERSFSAMTRVKTHLRSTMGQERLSDLVTICVERSASADLDYDKVIDAFAELDLEEGEESCRRLRLHSKNMKR